MTPLSEKEIKVLARKLIIEGQGETRILTLQILTLMPSGPDKYEIIDITPYTAEQPATTYISAPLEATATRASTIVIAKAIMP